MAATFNKTRQNVKRKRWLQGFAILLSLLLAFAVFQAVRAESKRKEAEYERAKADNNAQEAKRNLAELYEEQGRQSLLKAKADPMDAFVYLSEAYKDRAELKKQENSTALRLLLGQVALTFRGQIESLQGHRNRILSVQFSANGDRLVTVSTDNTAKLWDTNSGKVLAVFPGDFQQLRAAVLSPEGGRLLMIGYDYSPGDGENPGVYHVAASLRDALKKDPVKFYRLGSDEVNVGDLNYTFNPGFSSDGKTFAMEALDEGKMKTGVDIFSATTGDKVSSFAGEIRKAKFRSGKTISTLQFADGFLCENPADDKIAQKFEEHISNKSEISDVSPDRSHLITIDDGIVSVRDLRSFSKLATLNGHKGPAMFARFNPSGSIVATVGEDNRVVLWDWAATETPVEAILPFKCEEAWFTKSDQIVSLNQETGLQLVDFRGHALHTIKDSTPKSETGRISNADGTRLVMVNQDGKTRLWDTIKGQSLAILGDPAAKTKYQGANVL
jgi:WD40 repeat protein